MNETWMLLSSYVTKLVDLAIENDCAIKTIKINRIVDVDKLLVLTITYKRLDGMADHYRIRYCHDKSYLECGGSSYCFLKSDTSRIPIGDPELDNNVMCHADAYMKRVFNQAPDLI